MIKQNLTDITIILDESGSMTGDRTKTISAINEFIQGQKQTQGQCNLTLITFSSGSYFGKTQDWSRTVWNGLNIKEIFGLSEDNYSPKGGTPLYDACGKAIIEAGQRFSKMKEEDRPSKVLFVIFTDGAENTSKEFRLSKLKEMIQHQETVFSWNFLFLGADFSTKEQTSSMGLSADRSYDFSKVDMIKSVRGLSKAVSDYRGTKESKLYSNFAGTAKTYADQENN